MELKEAIDHVDEVIKSINCEECKKDRLQLKAWLIELMERRSKDGYNESL